MESINCPKISCSGTKKIVPPLFAALLLAAPTYAVKTVTTEEYRSTLGSAISHTETQMKKVTGVVKDSNGEPLPGVNIAIKGGGLGTITNVDGTFELDVSEGNPILVFSFVGFETKEVPFSGQTHLDVVLKTDIKSLSEVVVVGYGSQRKEDLTGSVSSISNKAFVDMPASSSNSILQGKAPGVVVRRGNGAPGSKSSIRIRGANSILGNNDPLIVVDGNYMESLPDMYDIESVEILKDASATAIYGSRGANGVVIVTTKRGKEGNASLKIYSNVSIENLRNKYDLLDAAEYAEFNNQAGYTKFTQEQINNFKTKGGTDWQDAIFQTGISQNHKVILSGGGKNVRYFLSPTMAKSSGIMTNTEWKKNAIYGKVDIDLNDRLTFQLETGIDRSNNLNPGLGQGGSKTSNPIYSALLWSPTEPIYQENGMYQRADPYGVLSINPVLLTTIRNTNYNNNGQFVGNVKFNIAEGFDFNGKAQLQFLTGGSRNFENPEYHGSQANASQSSYETNTTLLNGFFTYNKKIENTHSISAMIGYEQIASSHTSFYANANNLAIQSVDWHNMGLAASQSIGSNYSNDALRSYFGRLNYNWSSKYFLTASYRVDGSSKFRTGNQFSHFPSFAVSWRLSEESFLKDNTAIQNLKLRAGWGKTGSQAISPYATYSPMNTFNYGWGTSSVYAGYFPGVGGNPLLQWEVTAQANAGLDFTALGGKLNVSLDYYQKQTSKLLSRMSVPAYNGGGTVNANVGQLENRGFEASLNYNVLDRPNLSYDFNLNGTYNYNNVLDIGEQERLYGEGYGAGFLPNSPFVIMKGQPLGTLFGYKYLGIWQQSEASQAAEFGQAPGDYKYEDLNGNKQYDAGDYQVIGHSNPKFTWGFNNHFSVGKFDINVLFEGLHGRDILNMSYQMAASVIDQTRTINLKEATDRWSPENTDAKFSKISTTNKQQPLSSQFVQNGSYVKLRNISVSYRLPSELVKSSKIKLTASAQNVLVLTKYKGYDPEVSSTAGSDINSGMDWFAYPNPVSYSFGVGLEF